jgi:uncharacterized repeat protein (TIGR01451 family)
MKKVLINLSICLISALSSFSAYASTAAGTIISNVATISFSQGQTSGFMLTSQPASFTVNELIDVQLTWVDTSQVSVSTPDYRKVLTFKLTNTGNNTQNYTLSANPSIGGGNFNPIQNGNSIYVENNLQTGLQLTGSYQDTVYNQGSTITLNSGDSKLIYLVYDIPSNLAIGNKGYAQISAISTTQGINLSTKPGTILQTPNKPDALVGYSGGHSVATGNYLVNNLQVVATKTVIATKDPQGGNTVTSQSVLTYQISVVISGTGTAKNLTINDTLPTQEDYVPNTLSLNNVALPDSGNVVGDVINVKLGDKNAPQTYNLVFQARIK